jgi:hypothetical protein
MGMDNKTWVQIGVAAAVIGLIPPYVQMFRPVAAYQQTEQSVPSRSGNQAEAFMNTATAIRYGSPLLGTALLFITVLIAFRKPRAAKSEAASSTKGVLELLPENSDLLHELNGARNEIKALKEKLERLEVLDPEGSKIKHVALVAQWRIMVADVFAEAKRQHKDPAEMLVNHPYFNGLHPYLGEGTKNMFGPVGGVRHVAMEMDRGAPMSTLQRLLLHDIDAAAIHWGVDSPRPELSKIQLSVPPETPAAVRQNVPNEDQSAANRVVLPVIQPPPTLSREYSREICLHGPDGIDLLIYPSGDACRCKLLNGTLSIVRAFQIMITPVRSFDSGRLAWSDPIPFRGMMGPTTTPTNPREFTREFNFVVPQQNGLRIGDHVESVLTWPSGDSAPVQRWRIPIRVFAHPVIIPGHPSDSQNFDFEICLRWATGRSFEFMEYADTIPPAGF